MPKISGHAVASAGDGCPEAECISSLVSTFTRQSRRFPVFLRYCRCLTCAPTLFSTLARSATCRRGDLVGAGGTTPELRDVGHHDANPPEGPVLRKERLGFQRLLQTHIPSFGASPSLTHFTLGFPTDIELCLIADLISALPSLRHLQIYGGSFTVVQFETVPVIDTFPPHLHSLDLWLDRDGINLFLDWLSSHSQPPIITSLWLEGCARGSPIAPMEAYLQLHGPAIETLSLRFEGNDYLGHSPTETQTFEKCALACTPGLVNLSLVDQDPATIATTLMLLPSIHIVSLEISVRLFKFRHPDWSRIDEIVANRFASLRRISSTYSPPEKSFSEIRALMPRASARGILVLI
ncbi:hypothetical protein B0H19DRAFT_1305020 [Mycena capillaripes]|nr:hypothetical protein B0H19DRAFT_1305020 [Mycena capillaripes]